MPYQPRFPAAIKVLLYKRARKVYKRALINCTLLGVVFDP